MKLKSLILSICLSFFVVPTLNEVYASNDCSDENGEFLLNDANNDGFLNTNDVFPFVLALTDPISYQMEYPDVVFPDQVDSNEDGLLNTNDITPFVTINTASFAATLLLSGSNTDPSVIPDLNLSPGESGELYIWADLEDGEQLSAVSLDVLISADNVLSATGFVTDNPDVILGFSEVPRWQGNLGTGTFNQPGKLVENAVSLFVTFGAGLFQLAGANGADTGTVVDGNVFLHATVQFDAVAAGAAELRLGVGSSLIQRVGTGEYVPDFGPAATISVIPEPASLMLAGLGLIGLVGSRRRAKRTDSPAQLT